MDREPHLGRIEDRGSFLLSGAWKAKAKVSVWQGISVVISLKLSVFGLWLTTRPHVFSHWHLSSCLCPHLFSEGQSDWVGDGPVLTFKLIAFLQTLSYPGALGLEISTHEF